ncbi:MAG: hypothetical protein ACAI25_07100 [Planctomycetota bacterium]
MTQDQSAPTTPETPKKKKGIVRRLFKWTFILLVLIGIVLAAAPAVASATFLTGTVRGQLKKQFGENAEVGKVSFGWTTGLAIEKLRIPGAAPHAKQKDRNAVELEGLHADLSLVKIIQAAATGGEAETVMTVDSAKIYLELHPNGKTNLAMPEGQPAATATSTAPVDSKVQTASASSEGPLPCSAKSRIEVKSIDLEIADMTSSTGTVQRTIVKGLRMGLVATVDKQRNAEVKTLGGADAATVAFDGVTITQEEPNKPARLVVDVEKTSVVAEAKFAGKPPESASKAPISGAVAAHQVEMKPTKPLLHVARVHGEDYDLRGLAINVSLAPTNGKPAATFTLDGTLHGLHDGGIHVEGTADLGAGKGTLPATFAMNLKQVDISGYLAKQLPLILPVLDGSESGEKGKNKLPALSFNTKGSIDVKFDAKEQFDRSPSLKTILDDGEMLLGPGSFDGSKILQSFVKAFEKLELKEYLEKAAGGDPFAFEGVIENYAVKDGVVTIKKLEMTKQGFGIALSGTVDFGGHYILAIHFDEKMYAKLDKDVAKLLQAVDKAGGIGVTGDLAGGCTFATPPADVLAKALLEGGALDMLRAKNPKLAASFDGALGKAGTSVDKIVNDPGQAAKDVAKDQATKQTDKVVDQNKEKIEKATGVSGDKVKDGLKGMFGGSDEKKEEPKKDETKPDETKPEEKKEEKKPLFKNPFGG